MTRRNNNRGSRSNTRHTVYSDDAEQLLARIHEASDPANENATETPEQRQALEKPREPQLSTKVAQEVNLQVKALFEGVSGIHTFYEQREQNEQFADFFEKNKDDVEKILKIDLNGTYQELEKNAETRSKIHTELVKEGVISKQELQQLRGIVSNEPYTRYVRSLKPNATHRQGLIELTDQDREDLSTATINDIQPTLTRLKSENKINDDEERKLIELGPKTDEQIQQAKERIEAKIQSWDVSQNTSYLSRYKEIQKREEELSAKFGEYREQYNRIVEGLVKQIQQEYDKAENEKRKDSRIRSLQEQTGLPMKKGQVLWGVEVINGRAGSQKNNRVEIKDITFGEPLEDPNVQAEFRVLQPSLEPIITFTTKAESSQNEVELKMSASNFRKWLLNHQVSENFESVEELETALGLPDFIKPGQTFEYIDYEGAANMDRDEEGFEFPKKTVKIERILDDKIQLDQEVLIDPQVEGAQLTNPIKKKTLDFGEFARWYRKMKVVPEDMSLEMLDKLLAEHHSELLVEMGWPEDHGSPIKINNGEFPQYLISADNPGTPPVIKLTVTGVNKDGLIETKEGDTISPKDFYRAVQENKLTRPTKDQLKEIQKITKTTEKGNSGLQSELTAIAAASTTPKDSKKAKVNENGKGIEKSFWNRLKDGWTNTKFLSLIEMYELFLKAPVDRVQEWLKDQSERKVADVGKRFHKGYPKFGGLNDLSTKYEDIANGKFAGDVKAAEEFFEKNYTDKQVFEHLYNPASKAIFRAALQRLSKKGKLRWEDDTKLQEAINKTLKNTTYPEKFHEKLGSTRTVVVGDKKALEMDPALDVKEQCKAIIDNEWGTGVFDSLEGGNEREYREVKEATANNMHKFEYMHGGIGNSLKKMIYDWEHGREVKQAEFDGLLQQAILGTEVSAQQAFLLLVAAFSVKNPKTGQTVLSYSRLNPYVGALKKHQLFFYFASGYEQLDENGNVITIQGEDGTPQAKKGKIDMNRFQKIFREVISKDIEAAEASGHTGLQKYEAGKNTLDWMQREVLSNKLVKLKMAENAGSSDIDVNYYQFLGPLITAENLDKVLTKSYGSLQKPHVLANMYAGYNNQLAIKARMLNSGSNKEENEMRVNEFTDMVYSVIYFNNILRDRIKRNQPYMRMEERTFDTPPMADPKRKTIEFCEEIEKFLAHFARGIAEKTGDAELKELSRVVLESGTNPIPDELDAKIRNSLRRNALKLAASAPEELAAIAQTSAGVLKGMSGAQLTAAEMKEAKGAAGAIAA